jgi:hypothetical protein
MALRDLLLDHHLPEKRNHNNINCRRTSHIGPIVSGVLEGSVGRYSQMIAFPEGE